MGPLNGCTILALVWSDWRRPREISIRIFTFQTDFDTRDHPITDHERLSIRLDVICWTAQFYLNSDLRHDENTCHSYTKWLCASWRCTDIRMKWGVYIPTKDTGYLACDSAQVFWLEISEVTAYVSWESYVISFSSISRHATVRFDWDGIQTALCFPADVLCWLFIIFGRLA